MESHMSWIWRKVNFLQQATQTYNITTTIPTFKTHTCEPVASKMLEKFTGELAKKRENFVGLRYVKNEGK